MSFSRARFLIEVLGPEGAKALAKAAARHEHLAQVLVPRTILAWLGAVPQFEGEIPGLAGGTFKFQKSESGFTGSIKLSSGDYEFKDATIFYVAGAVATAMEWDSLAFGNASNAELERLGKSIDLMAKVRIIKAETEKKSKKGTCEVCGGKGGKHDARLIGGLVLDCRNDPKKLTKGAANEGGRGSQAAPIAPKAPEAPAATAPQPTTKQISPLQPKKEAIPKVPTPKAPKPVSTSVKLTQSESNKPCPVCSLHQFTEGQFTGCLCFRVLAKSVTVVGHDVDYVDLELGEGWDRPSVLTLLEAVGRR
jgi:hypothetical protein